MLGVLGTFFVLIPTGKERANQEHQRAEPERLQGSPQAVTLLRCVASRRRERWDMRVVSATISLLHTDKSLFLHRPPRITFDLEAPLVNVL